MLALCRTVGAVPVRRFLLGVFFGVERVGLRRAVGSTSAGGTRSRITVLIRTAGLVIASPRTKSAPQQGQRKGMRTG